MLLPSAVVSLLAAVALGHSTHEEQQFSQERLDELERKWGIDVSGNQCHSEHD